MRPCLPPSLAGFMLTAASVLAQTPGPVPSGGTRVVGSGLVVIGLAAVAALVYFIAQMRRQ